MCAIIVRGCTARRKTSRIKRISSRRESRGKRQSVLTYWVGVVIDAVPLVFARESGLNPSINNSLAFFYRLDFVSLPRRSVRFVDEFSRLRRDRGTLAPSRVSLSRRNSPFPAFPSSPTTRNFSPRSPPFGFIVLLYLLFHPARRFVSLSRILSLSSPYFYFISVPSSSLASSAIPPCSPVVGSADFFLGYRPVDRAAIRWTAIRIDYSLPKLRRGVFILYNSPAALVPSLLFPRFFLARYNRASSRARRHPCARSCERKTTRGCRRRAVSEHGL